MKNMALPPVPVDVLEQILMYLPIKNLLSLALASKYFLAPILLESHIFPKRHCRFQQAMLRRASIDWDPSLPLKYKVALYHIIMTSDDERLDKGTWRGQRFKLGIDDLETACILETIVTQYPDFFPHHNNRILRQALLNQQENVMQMLLNDSRLGFGSSGSLFLEALWFQSECDLIHRQASQDKIILKIQKTDVSPALLSLIQDVRVIISDVTVMTASGSGRWSDVLPWGFDFWNALHKNPCVKPGVPANDALYKLCEKGNVPVVKLVLASGHVDPSFENNAAISIARLQKNDEVVQTLLADSRIRLPWWQWAYYRYYTDSNARCLDYGSRFTMAFAQVALDGLRKIMSMLGLEHLSNQYLWTATFCWTFLFIIFAYFCSVYRFGFRSYSLRGCSVVMGLLVSFGLLKLFTH